MIRFKLRYSVQDIFIQDEDIHIELKITHNIKIKLTKPDENYLQRTRSRNVSFCEAELLIIPKENNVKILNDIINGNIVKSTKNLPTPYGEIMNQQGKKIILPPLSIFPEHFKSFINQISSELKDAINSAVSVIRWYKNNRGSHSPFAFLDFKWTSDGINWYEVPNSIHVSVDLISDGIKFDKKDEEFINSLLKEDNIEPIYHSLFREAWGQRNKNHRSSIIMAISAVEVSIKQLIEKIIPDATWIISKLQSPPIYLIFKEYLPKLKLDNKFNGVTILPPERIIDNLKKWVTIRNEITHHGKKALSGDELNEMLLTIKDILHIIDFNCGHKWSIYHIRKETLNEIGIK